MSLVNITKEVRTVRAKKLGKVCNMLNDGKPVSLELR